MKGIFFEFLRFPGDFERFLEAEMDAKIDVWEVFSRCFFRMRFDIDFSSISGDSDLEKSTQTIVFSMVFANFYKINVFEKVAKNQGCSIDFWRLET